MATTTSVLHTMYSIAARAIFYWSERPFGIKNRPLKSVWASSLLGTLATCAVLVLAGCATPQAPVAKAVYDFGPARSSAGSPKPDRTATNTAALALAEVDASTALDGLNVVYRLAYADAQQLRPYALARWSMPPAQLVRTRLRDALSARGPVLGPAEGATPWLLKVELDEFSQQFDAPASSSGAVRLHASLFNANKLVAQRTVQAMAPAPSQDAAGGVRALTAATDDAVAQLATWVAEQMR